MHRDVWTYYNGKIPKGYHIHHIDENTANNDISNLEMLEGREHLSNHMQERMKDPSFVDTLHKRMDYAREYANKWHGSKEGIEWHKKHGKEVAENMQPKEFVCLNCGHSFIAKPIGLHKFCCNACKTAYRLKQGVDNETRKCVVCGNEFVTNKYYPKRTCSKKCANRLLSKTRKKMKNSVY